MYVIRCWFSKGHRCRSALFHCTWFSILCESVDFVLISPLRASHLHLSQHRRDSVEQKHSDGRWNVKNVERRDRGELGAPSSPTPVHTWLLFRRRVSHMIIAAKRKLQYLKKQFLSNSSLLSVSALFCQMKNTASVGRWRDSLTNCHGTKVYKRKKNKATSCTDRQKIQQSEHLPSVPSAETQWAAGTQQSLWTTRQTRFHSQLTFWKLKVHPVDTLNKVFLSRSCISMFSVKDWESFPVQWWKKCSDPRVQRQHHYKQSKIWGRIPCDQNTSNF